MIIVIVLATFILRFLINLSFQLRVVYDVLLIIIVFYPVFFVSIIRGYFEKIEIICIIATSLTLYVPYLFRLLTSGQIIGINKFLAFDTILYGTIISFIFISLSYILALWKTKHRVILRSVYYIIHAALIVVLIWCSLSDAKYFLFLLIIYYCYSLIYITFIVRRTSNFISLRKIILLYISPIVVLLVICSVLYGIIVYTLAYSTNSYQKVDLVANLLTHNRWCYLDNDCLFKLVGQSKDLFTWLIFGYSRCGGVARIGTDLLNQYGVEAYYAGFPGEDHFFVVVNISGRLYVIDPGLYDKAVTMEKRIRDRLKNWGGLSYIAVYHGDEVIELTDKYPDILPYDTIIIQVLNNSRPVPNACITLRHKFQTYKTTEIPGKEHCLYTDSNGEVIIHLGIPHYKDDAEIYEPFFHVYIDGKDTGIIVTSTGTNTTHYIVVPYPSNK